MPLLFSTTSLQQRYTQRSPVQGEAITDTQVKMTGQKEVLVCVSSFFPPPYSLKRLHFAAPPQSPASDHICSYGQALGQTGLDDLAEHPPKGTLQSRPSTALGPWVGSPPLPPSCDCTVGARLSTTHSC